MGEIKSWTTGFLVKRVEQ